MMSSNASVISLEFVRVNSGDLGGQSISGIIDK